MPEQSTPKKNDSENQSKSTDASSAESIVSRWSLSAELKRTLGGREKYLPTARNLLKEFQAEKNPLVLVSESVVRWHHRLREQEAKEKITKSGFNFAEELFVSNQIPLGSCLKYISEADKKLLPQEEKNAVLGDIPLENGAFLSLNPPIKKNLPSLGVITPQGSIYYYHAPANEKESLKKLHPLENYYKLCLNQNADFEAYCCKTSQAPICPMEPQKIILIKNREGEEFIKKRTEIPLHVFDNAEQSVLAKVQESFTRFIDDFSNAIEKTANIDADIFEPYSAQILSFHRVWKMEIPEENETDDVNKSQDFNIEEKLYVERVLPYKGMSLDKLLQREANRIEMTEDLNRPSLTKRERIALAEELSHSQLSEKRRSFISRMLEKEPLTAVEKSVRAKKLENIPELTDEHRIDIAKQCVALLCSLYDHNNSLSKSGKLYSHGHIDLSHYCVMFETNHAGEREPKVSLVGFKEPCKNNAIQPRIRLDGYAAPEERMPVRNSDTLFKKEVFSAGNVLFPGESEEVEGAGTRKKVHYFSKKALTIDVTEALLLNIDESRLSATKKSEYIQLKMLAKQMTDPNPKNRPQLEDLKMAFGLFPAMDTLKTAIVHAESSEERRRYEEAAEKAMSLMKALVEYKAHKEKGKNALTSFMSSMGFKQNNLEKITNESRAVLNSTQPSEIVHELEKLFSAVQNPNGHRGSFASFLLKSLGQQENISDKALQECRVLVTEMSIEQSLKLKPQSKKNNLNNDYTAEVSDESVSHKKFEKKEESMFRRSNRVIPGMPG